MVSTSGNISEIEARISSSLTKAADALYTFLSVPASPSGQISGIQKNKQSKRSKPSSAKFEPFGNSEKEPEPTPTSTVTLDLFEKLSSVHLLITFNNPPSDRLEPVSCIVPHIPLRIATDETATAFLLVKYPQRKIKDIVFGSPKLSSIIRKVSDEDKFRKKFSRYESRRTLCRSFPSLLVDERILPAYIPLMFGKEAIGHNRFPVSVCVHKGADALEKDLEKALKTVQVSFRGQQTLNVCLGYTSNLSSGTHIAENVLAVLSTIFSTENLIQRGWVDIESIALEDSSSRARLLVYAHNYLEETEWLRDHPSTAETEPNGSLNVKSLKIRLDGGVEGTSEETSLPPPKRMKQSIPTSATVLHEETTVLKKKTVGNVKRNEGTATKETKQNLGVISSSAEKKRANKSPLARKKT